MAVYLIPMKNMLSKEDLLQIQKMLDVTFDIRLNAFDKKAVQPLRNAIGNLKVDFEELKIQVKEEMVSNTKKILDRFDDFVKKNETLEAEQKIQTARLDRHQAWIEKAGKKVRIGIARYNTDKPS